MLHAIIVWGPSRIECLGTGDAERILHYKDVREGRTAVRDESQRALIPGTSETHDGEERREDLNRVDEKKDLEISARGREKRRNQ